VRAGELRNYGAKDDPVTLIVANRLFGQAGYDFRESFLELVSDNYGAPFEPLDFSQNPASATQHINGWVEGQTRQRIRNLIPGGALNNLTRLVLVNAIYLKAPWSDGFRETATRLLPFQLAGGELVAVPTMIGELCVGYAQREGFTAVTIPYGTGEIQFLILMPDQVNGLAELELNLTPRRLGECAGTHARHIILHLPKFKLEPPMMPLSRELQALGMKSAFDLPPGSANFDGIAPRRTGEYLYISEVFHKTFLNLDEKGTEAAAATAVEMADGAAAGKPVEVHIDHPFLFAIQHRRSGACLFLGHVADPR
jgi:serpin B